MSENNIENAIQTVDDMLRNRKSKMHITDCLAISVVLKEIRRLVAREKELIEEIKSRLADAERWAKLSFDGYNRARVDTLNDILFLMEKEGGNNAKN